MRRAPSCRGPSDRLPHRRIGRAACGLDRPSRGRVGAVRAAGLVLLAGVLPLLAGGCVTSFANDSSVEQSIGRATMRDFVDEVPQVLGSNGYTIHRRRRTSRLLSFETNWMYRAPFEDEADRGASAARTRIFVSARISAGNIYSVRARAENEVRGVPGADDMAGTGWSRIPATEMYRAYARDLFLKIRLQVDAGVRIRR